MRETKWTIRKSDLAYACLLFPFFSNYYMTYVTPLYYLTMVAKVMITAYAVIGFTRGFKHLRSLGTFGRLTILYMLLLLVSTFINHGNIVRYIGYFISSAGWIILTKYLYNKNERAYITGLYYVFRINIYLDAILLILYPNGLVGGRIRYTFLGMDNISTPMILCSFAVFVIYNELVRTRRFNFGLLLDISVSGMLSLYLLSGTGITGILVFMILFFMFCKYPKFVTYKKCIIILAVVFVLINILNNVAFVAPYVQGILGKDLTFTDRTDIWASAIALIKQNFWWGKGIQENQFFVLAISNGKYKPAHNEYLQTMLNGGVFYTIVFVCIIITVGALLDRATQRNRNMYGFSLCCIKACILGLLTMFLAEAYGNQLILFVMCGLVDYLLDCNNRYTHSTT